jgi:hypothetical protein
MPVVDLTTKIRNAFEKAKADDKKIDGDEADALIREVRTGRLTESKAEIFKKEAARFRSSFTPDAKKKIDKFISGTMPRVEILDRDRPNEDKGKLKDPAVLKADKDKLEQELVKGGKLFKNGVKGTDPEQNYIGDCYLMAAMSSVAKASPDVIKNAFKQNRDGTFTVRLWDRKGRKLVPHDVRIDLDLPRNGWNGYNYARAHDPRELWPALLEKAFAVRAGSYSKIEAGIPGEAMAAITGKLSTEINLRGKGVSANDVFDQIAAGVKAKKPMTAATLGDSSNAKYANTNIFADHTYTIWGTSTENGVKYVHLRNPWGNTEPKGNGKDDGVFKLDLKKFMSLYSGVAING